VLRIVTQAVLAELKQNPNAQNISVSQNDNERYAMSQVRHSRPAGGTPMGSLLTFVNAVADGWPSSTTGQSGHAQLLVLAQATHTKARPNVQIQLCSIECCSSRHR